MSIALVRDGRDTDSADPSRSPTVMPPAVCVTGPLLCIVRTWPVLTLPAKAIPPAPAFIEKPLLEVTEPATDRAPPAVSVPPFGALTDPVDNKDRFVPAEIESRPLEL